MKREVCVFLVLWLCISFVSCRKFTIVQPPSGHFTTDSVFADAVSAFDAMQSVPRHMMQIPCLFNGHDTKHIGYYGGEFARVTPGGADSGFQQRRLSARDQLVYLAWYHCYEAINSCNRVLALLPQSDKVSGETKTLLAGEAKFYRAFCYYYLVNLFGGVPLITGLDYQENRHVPRAPDSAVYQLIIDDLQAAAIQLPEKDPSGDSLPYRRVRPSKWAALALLSEVYLSLQQWAAAEEAASQVIHSGLYSLEDSVQDVFQVNSRETILQLQTRSNVTDESLLFTTAEHERPTVQASKNLVDRFEIGDRRLSNWLSTHRIGNKTYYGIRKYHTNKINPQYSVKLRLAGVLLNRAEARLRLGKLASATDDLNQIRSRAQASLLPTGMPLHDLLTWLAGERQRELFAERGRYFFDLKRWFLEGDQSSPLFQVAQQNFSSPPQVAKWALWWPIPHIERVRNPQLVQNEAY